MRRDHWLVAVYCPRQTAGSASNDNNVTQARPGPTAIEIRVPRENGLLSPALSSKGGEGEETTGTRDDSLISMAVRPGPATNRRFKTAANDTRLRVVVVGARGQMQKPQLSEPGAHDTIFQTGQFVGNRCMRVFTARKQRKRRILSCAM